MSCDPDVTPSAGQQSGPLPVGPAGYIGVVHIESLPEDLQAHFYTEHHAPPLMVYQSALALVGKNEIKAALTTYTAGQKPAVWSSWLVLEHALGRLEVAFDADFWEQDEEQQGSRYVQSTVTQCWIRPLKNVVKYQITGLGPVANERAPWWAALHGVKLTFSDGEVVDLPGDSGLHSRFDRDASSKFHIALKTACGL